MTPADYCRGKAAPSGSSFYYSCLFQAESIKRALYAIFALAAEIQQAIHAINDPGVARLKLRWWQDEISRMYKADSNHPIGIELTSVINRYHLPQSKFMQFLEHTETQITPINNDDYDAWLRHHMAATGSIWQLAAEICEYKDTASVTFAAKAGALAALLDMLQNIPHFTTQGYCPLPGKEMQQCGVTTAMLNKAGNNPDLVRFFAVLVERLCADCHDCISRFPRQDRKALLFCLIRMQIAVAICREIKADGYQLLQQRIALTPIRKLWIAWRTKVMIGDW